MTNELPLPTVEVLWEVPIREGPITGMVLRGDDIYVSCARRVFRLRFDYLDQVTAEEAHIVPSNDNP